MKNYEIQRLQASKEVVQYMKKINNNSKEYNEKTPIEYKDIAKYFDEMYKKFPEEKYIIRYISKGNDNYFVVFERKGKNLKIGCDKGMFYLEEHVEEKTLKPFFPKGSTIKMTPYKKDGTLDNEKCIEIKR